MKRLFIAANIPNTLKERIGKNFLKKISPKEFSIVKKENLHITICFLGNKNQKQEQQIIQALKELHGKKIKVKLAGISSFNNRVLFVKIVEGEKELKKISDFLFTKNFGDKKFSAHLTIARNKNASSKKFLQSVESLDKSFSAEFKVESIDLMESKLSPRGATYYKVFEQKLK